jgi:Chaperone of endosialidase
MKTKGSTLFRLLFFCCAIFFNQVFAQNVEKTAATKAQAKPKTYAKQRSPQQFLLDQQINQKNILLQKSIADVVQPDDFIIQGSECIGFDCVDGESFGFDTERLKENNTRIGFNDTSVGAFPSNDWTIVANESASGGANYLGFEDVTGAKFPFKVIAGAATNSLVVDNIGRIGLRTATPVLDIHMATSNTPGMRFEQNSSGGFSAQTWDMAGNEANFFIRDVTGGSRLPFRIRPGAPTSSIDIAATGNVGIGTASPSVRLHLSETAEPIVRLAKSGGTAQSWDIGNDGTTFYVKDVTGTVVPLKIENTAPDNSLYIGASNIYIKNAILPSASLPSDLRLKTNIANFGNAIDLIQKLRPKTFNYDITKFPDLGFEKELQYGLIAQEVEQTLPTLVRNTQFPNKQQFKTVNYTGLVPILIKAMQEQQSEIEQLKAKLSHYEELNARMTRIEAMLKKEEAEIKTDKK